MKHAIENVHQFPLLQRAEVMMVTPELAEKFLATNTNNRPVRPTHVRALAHSIMRGEWVVSHQGIAFSTQGVLLDGQHRLRAIVVAGTPVQMVVTTGVSESAFKVIDCGVRRTLADLTQLPKQTAEVCSLIGSFLKYGCVSHRGDSVSPAVILQIADSGVGVVCERLRAYSKTATVYYSTRAMRTAAVLTVLDGADEDYVFGLHADLCNCRLEVLPPVALYLHKQLSKKLLHSQDTPTLTVGRGLVVFNVANKDKSRFNLADDTTSNVLRLTQRLMKDRGVEL